MVLAYWSGCKYLDELVLILEQQASSCSHVVVLQRGLVIVSDGQRVSCLDQEVIVQTTMLVVVRDGRPVR